jgi:hypothetical protein
MLILSSLHLIENAFSLETTSDGFCKLVIFSLSEKVIFSLEPRNDDILQLIRQEIIFRKKTCRQ